MSDVRISLAIAGVTGELPPPVPMGDSVTLRIAAVDAVSGAAVAATGVTLRIQQPSGDVTTLAVGDLTAGATGIWTYNLDLDMAGQWLARPASTGPVASAGEDLPITVLASDTSITPLPTNARNATDILTARDEAVAAALQAATAGAAAAAPLVAAEAAARAAADAATLAAANAAAPGLAPVQSVAGLTGSPNAAAVRTALGMASVATSGAYTDLSAKPTLGGAASLNVGTTSSTVAAGDVGAAATAHITRTDNPHGTTAAQVGALPAAGGDAPGVLTSVGVASIAALRSRSVAGLTSGAVVVVQGYYAANDGGGGWFVWNAVSVSADDGGLVIAPSGASTGRWVRFVSGAWDWRWWGAKGDGATDDTTAIQAAYNAAAAKLLVTTEKAAVTFRPSPGGYLISSAINVTASSIETVSASLGGVAVISNSATADHFYINNGSSKINAVSFDGLTFLKTVTATSGYCLNFDYAFLCTARNCRIYGNSKQWNGMMFRRALQCHITKNQFEGTRAEALELSGADAGSGRVSDIYLTDNRFSGCNTTEAATTPQTLRGVVTLRDYVQGIFFNPTNEIYGSPGWAIKLAGTVASTSGNTLVFLTSLNVEGAYNSNAPDGIGGGGLYVANYNSVQVQGGWVSSNNCDTIYIESNADTVTFDGVWVVPQTSAGSTVGQSNAYTIGGQVVSILGGEINSYNRTTGSAINLQAAANFFRLDGTGIRQIGGDLIVAPTFQADGTTPFLTGKTLSINPGLYSVATNKQLTVNVATNGFPFSPWGGVSVQQPDNAITGGNQRGTGSIDLQYNRSNANQVASANYATISGGYENQAAGQYASCVGGQKNFINGQFAVGGGYNSAATGFNSTAFGRFATADAAYSVALGYYSTARATFGKMAWAGVSYSNVLGDTQEGKHHLVRVTTNATATRLTSDNGSASTTNSITLPNNGAYRVRAMVTARDTGNNDVASWTVEAMLKRGANAAATALVGSAVVTKDFADSGAATWALALTADTTNGGVAFTATGAAGRTIRWTAIARSVEST